MSITKDSKIEAKDVSIAIKNITRNGITFTFTRLDGTTGTFTQQDNTGGSIQTGMVVAFAANAVPSGGYLLCNGAAVSRTTYAALFSAIGTTYGTGDGSTTFNLPNLTNKFVMGSGTAGTVKAAGLPNITGNIVSIVSHSSFPSPSGAFYNNGAAINDNIGFYRGGSGSYYSVPQNAAFNASRSSSVYGSSSTVQPPALTMRYYIKY